MYYLLMYKYLFETCSTIFISQDIIIVSGNSSDCLIVTLPSETPLKALSSLLYPVLQLKLPTVVYLTVLSRNIQVL
jgi:hypothetical protein